MSHYRLNHLTNAFDETSTLLSHLQTYIPLHHGYHHATAAKLEGDDFIFYLFCIGQRDVQTGGSIIQTVTNLWQQLHLLETRQENNPSLRANMNTWSKKASRK